MGLAEVVHQGAVPKVATLALLRPMKWADKTKLVRPRQFPPLSQGVERTRSIKKRSVDPHPPRSQTLVQETP